MHTRGRNYNDIIFIGGNRVGTGYFRNVGNTQGMGTEIAVNGRLGKKNGLGLQIMPMTYVEAAMETSKMISSVGHPTNTNEDDTVEENMN